MNPVTMTPIGVVRSDRTEVVDDGWDAVQSHVELHASQFTPEALEGLMAFSHAEITFFMDLVDADKIERGARHPRNDTTLPRVGIWAQRAKNRPNQLGHTICRILGVDGLRIHLQGLDAVEGTPVLDIKPWMEEFGPRGPVHQPDWVREVMKRYW